MLLRDLYVTFMDEHERIVKELRPRPHVSGYFWIRNFLFPDTASVHTYPVNPAYESPTFWMRSPEWKFLNTLWIRNRVNAKSGNFLSGDVTRSSPILYLEYCIQDDNLAPKFSLLPVFTIHALLSLFQEESWVLEWIRIRVDGQIRFEYRYVWTWKFFNPERKKCGFKKYPDTCGRCLRCPLLHSHFL